jgi:hypothetical protein
MATSTSFRNLGGPAVCGLGLFVLAVIILAVVIYERAASLPSPS